MRFKSWPCNTFLTLTWVKFVLDNILYYYTLILKYERCILLQEHHRTSAGAQYLNDKRICQICGSHSVGYEDFVFWDMAQCKLAKLNRRFREISLASSESDPEDGANMTHRDVRWFSPHYTAVYHGIQNSSILNLPYIFSFFQYWHTIVCVQEFWYYFHMFKYLLLFTPLL
jgi:hypothetical protein